MAPVQPQEVSSIGQDEHENLETLFRNVDLSVAEEQIHKCYHATGLGRPPRNPIGVRLKDGDWREILKENSPGDPE